MRESALMLARGGWAVLPCDWRDGPHSKAPMTKHGHLEATRGEDIINEWWEEWPDALIGAKVPSTALVLDVDPRNGGSMEKLTEVLGPLPKPLGVLSGRGDGGTHLYFKRPTNVERFTGTKLPPGIDLKVNGYCIVPPSLHPATGDPYTWIPGDMLALPSRAVQLLIPPPRVKRNYGEGGNVSGLVATVASASSGNRNEALHWAARRAVEQDAPPEDFEKLVEAAMFAGIGEREARRTIQSAQNGETQ